jgi:hypothetical protein
MFAIRKQPNWKFALGIPVLIYVICFFVTSTSTYRIHEKLASLAIVFDLIVIAPLAYFVFIRKTRVPILSITRVFVAGTILCGLFIHTQSNPILSFIKFWILPVIECLVVFTVARNFYEANKKAKNEKTGKIDFLLHCKKVLIDVTGNERFGNILSTEISVVYYSLFGRKDNTADYSSRFSSYKESSSTMLLAVIIFLLLIETTSMHLIITMWSHSMAWLFTGLSLYTCLQLFGHIKAKRARPILINSDTIEIRNGLAGDVIIQKSNIESIELSSRHCSEKGTVKMALLTKLEDHNLTITLKESVEVIKMYGIKKRANKILFFVDKPKGFLSSISLF